MVQKNFQSDHDVPFFNSRKCATRLLFCEAIYQNAGRGAKTGRHYLDAFGRFQTHAGVSTAVLLFTKTNSGGTDRVWFYDMKADGLSLDDKRTELHATKHENNNLPDILARWHGRVAEAARSRTDQSFLVPKSEIAANDYDLSINRYKEVEYEEVDHTSPTSILAELELLENEIQDDLKALGAMIG